jgi:hypothetical protein
MLRLDKLTLKEVFVGEEEQQENSNTDTAATITAADTSDMTDGERAAAELDAKVADEVNEMKNMVKWTMENGNQASSASASALASKTSILDRTAAWQKLMMLWIQLRKVCDHPYMFPGSEPEPYENGQHMVYASSKMLFLDKLLPHLLANGHKALIFSNFTS